MSNQIVLTEKRTAFRRRIRSYILKNTSHKILNEFLTDAFIIFDRETRSVLTELHLMKVNVCMELKFIKKSSDPKEAANEITRYFQTKKQ